MISFTAVVISFVSWIFIPVIGAAAFGFCLFSWICSFILPDYSFGAGVIGGILFFIQDSARHQ
ncbi:hypothetical protein A4G20_08695 [Pasteurellaceae bacterium RH1A]|nr:hypothetical protein A4G20_08695 [Pasteurellaceae bacterium RH1A]